MNLSRKNFSGIEAGTRVTRYLKVLKDLENNFYCSSYSCLLKMNSLNCVDCRSSKPGHFPALQRHPAMSSPKLNSTVDVPHGKRRAQNCWSLLCANKQLHYGNNYTFLLNYNLWRRKFNFFQLSSYSCKAKLDLQSIGSSPDCHRLCAHYSICDISLKIRGKMPYIWISHSNILRLGL